MATVAECAQAFETLAERMSSADPEVRRRHSFDRTISCRLTDLGVAFTGHLHDGQITDIRQLDGPADDGKSQVTLSMTSDDLIRLVDRELNMASAWATGRVKIDAKVTDLIKLRSAF